MGFWKQVSNLFKKSKYEEANYLSLVLTSDRVLALIWTFDEGQVKELGYGQKVFTNIDLLLHQTAVAIDTAGEEAKIDFEKTVFGLSSYWMEDGQLSQKSTKILKKLSDELDLEPQAFVPLAASVNHLLKIEKFPSPQVVAIGIFGPSSKQAFCEVHLIDKNKVVETKTTQLPPTPEKIQRLIEELAHDDQQLPARVIIYGIGQNDQLTQKITNTDWGKTFLHEPRFEFLDDKSLARATAYAQATDLLGHEPPSVFSTDAPSQQNQTEPAQNLDFDKKEQKKVNELGFIEGEDILLSKREAPPDEGENMKQSALKEEAQESITPQANSDETYAVEINKNIEESDFDKSPRRPKLPFFSTFLSLLKFPQNPKKLAIALLILLVLVTVASLAAGQFLTRAQVVIKVNANESQAKFEAKISDQIQGQTIKGTAQGNQKAVTTGSKKIGDPARGEVAILNWTTAPKTFSQKTAIIAKNGLKFTLDSDVEVASRSASIPGKNNIGATAQEVGENSNLSQGTEFTFVQFDEISYSAQAESAFTGGSERQVTVVTKEDIDRLEKSLTETVTARARENLKNKAAEKTLLDSAINIKINSKNFDKNADVEASILNLDMEIEAESIVFDENDLKKYLAQNSNSSQESEGEARPENIEILKIDSKQINGALTLSGNYKVKLVPKFNEEELKRQISAKSPKEARSILKLTPQVSDIEINYSPNIPFITSIPRDPNKISFKIETI